MKAFLIVMLGALAFGSVSVAQASSGDAWDEFRANVAESCRSALNLDPDAEILVEAFGSESFGFAVAEGEEGPMVCVYDKQTGATEIGTQFEVLL